MIKNIILLGFTVVSLAACSTVAGVGEDISKASRAVERNL